MEQTNLNSTSITEPSILVEKKIPIFVEALFRLYGASLILTGVLSLIAPLFTGFIAGALTGTKEGFYEGYKLYAFLAVGALPTFVMAYGLFHLRKWIIAGFVIQFVSQIIGFFLISKEELAVFYEVMSIGILILALLPVLILILAYIFRGTLKGKYIAYVPLVLITIGLILGGVLSFNSSNDANTAHQNRDDSYIEDNYPTLFSETLNQTTQVERKDVIDGVTIKPGVDRSVLDDDSINEVRWAALESGMISTRKGCVGYGAMSRASDDPKMKARGVALANACIFYLEGGR